MKVLYTAEATATGGREGRVRSADGVLDLDLVTPRELGGAGGHASNPEQLFAAGFSSCFENAFRLAARRRKTPVGQCAVTAKVGIGPDGAGGFQLSVELHVRTPELERDAAEQIAEDAHKVCPYSNAVKGNVDVQVFVDPAPEVI